ncbi:hypothetical protein BN946_scf184965.g9 [Trametes cinnabarina]|uniref:Uncharacterized protein n=1 Tax=Pycnoporus cinnabarinus TaxID=5643 RepID=A0A060SKG3_PYCCI|nr:hypothetical protein BN946_scf184965.g9 [Trametes cinnabarina]
MLVESAAPYTIVCLIAIVGCAKRSPLQIALLPMLGQLQAIPPLLIAFRVMEGRALTQEAWTTTLSFVASGVVTTMTAEQTKNETFDRGVLRSPIRDVPPPSYVHEDTSSGDEDIYTSLPVSRRGSRMVYQLRLDTNLSSLADLKLPLDEESSPVGSSTLSLPQYPTEAHTPKCTTCPCPWPRPV